MMEEKQVHCWQVISGELLRVNEEPYRDLSALKSHGFFDDHDEAHKVWLSVSMQNVDNAHYRARIISIY